MTVGTIGSFLVIILANNNAATDQAAQQKAYAAQMAESQKQQVAAAQTNADNSESFSAGYAAGTFDATSVKTLKADVLKEGTGDVIKSTDSINASYFGWTSDGKIFDSSKKKDAADAPVTFALSGVITGWGKGITGLKVGSIVELTIPSDEAYSTTGSGIIPANAPLQFIVEIHKVDNTKTKS
jgi:peptidylprolyl isomerase